MTNIFLTFCFDIGRIKRDILIKTAVALYKSLVYFKNDFVLYIYTNIDTLDGYFINNTNIKIIKHDINKIDNYYNCIWLNLSFYKAVIYKTLLIDIEITPIWIDLDTIVCGNINHLSEYDNFFVIQGTQDTKLEKVHEDKKIEANKYIQGNIWKINKDLLGELLELWNSLTVKPKYDFQGLLNFAYYFNNYYTKMNILGHDIDKKSINSLEIYNNSKVVHCDINNIKSNLMMNDTHIMDIRTFRRINFMSFTFYELQDAITNNNFNKFTDKNIRDFFMYCGLIQ
jgi:hypothetical protein